MEKMKKKMQTEYLFYLFLVISPFLDAFSFWYRKWNPTASVSPTTFLRLIIPCILLFFIFIKDKKSRKYLMIGGGVYFLYAIFHLVIYQKFFTTSAYGSVFHEAQYLLNYTYMMALFYLCYYFNQKKKLPKIYQALTLFLAGYVFLLYFALVTHTSSPTYIDGVGYKGWNASGNAIGSLLLITLVILLPYFFKEKKWYYFVLLIATGIYLMVFLGTRVGLLGFPLILGAYFFCFLLGRKSKRKFSRRKVIAFCFIFILLLGSSLFFISHSSTLKRQKNLEKEQNQVVDQKTGEISHITGDALAYVRKIEKEKMDIKFMDQAQQKSLVEMKRTADRLELDNSKRRVQQLIYHTYLIKNQKSISRILFGNGYLANYSEMTLEMELMSLVYNFGLLGFVLYLGFFVIILVKSSVTLFRNFSKRNSTYLYYLFGVALVYLLSLMAGYTFFHVSCMVAIVLLHILLWSERESLEKD